MDYLTLAFALAVVSALAALASLLLLPRVLRDAAPRHPRERITATERLEPRTRRPAPAASPGPERRRSLSPEMVALLMRRHG